MVEATGARQGPIRSGPLRALLSKDLRARGLLVAAAWMAGVAVVILSRHPRAFNTVACQLLLLFPPLATLLVNVSSLVGERTAGTSPFLHALPVGRRRIWRSKLLLCAAHLVVLMLAMSAYSAWVSSALWANGERWSLDARQLLYVHAAWLGGLLLAAYAFGLSVGTSAWTTTVVGAWPAAVLLGSLGAFVVHLIASANDVWLTAPAHLTDAPRWFAPFASSWLEIGELLLLGLLVFLAGVGALTRAADGEPRRRSRLLRRHCLTTIGLVGVVLIPLNIAANRASAVDVMALGSVALSPNRDAALAEVWVRRWGRYLMGRIGVIDLASGELRLVARGTDAKWRTDGDGFTFARSRLYTSYSGAYTAPHPSLLRHFSNDGMTRPVRLAAMDSTFGRDKRRYLVRTLDRATGRIVFGARAPGGGIHGYYLVSAEGKEVWSEKSFGSTFPTTGKLRWVPNGHGLLATRGEWCDAGTEAGRVWFLSTEEPLAKLLASNVPGGDPVNLKAPAEARWVSFRARGTNGNDDPSHQRLYIRQLERPWGAHDEQVRGCAWAGRDDRLFLLTTHNPPELHALDCSTGARERIAVVPTSVAKDANVGPVSPNGELVPLMLSHFTQEKRRWSPLHTGSRTIRKRELWVVDTERREPRLLKRYEDVIREVGNPRVPDNAQADMAWTIGWLNDRELLLYEQSRRLVAVHAGTGEERVVFQVGGR